MTVCPQAFIVIPLTVPLTAEPIKGIILATFNKLFSPALDINLIPKILLILVNVLRAKEAGKKIISIAASKLIPGYGIYKSTKTTQKAVKILYKGVKKIF